MSVPVGAALAVLLVGLCYTGAAYGVYNFVTRARMPLRRPTAVTAGETVAMDVEIADSTPTIDAPFSGAETPIVYWRIRRRSPGEGPNTTIAADVWHADTLEVTADGYTIPADLPEDLSPGHLPDTPRFVEVAAVTPDEEPPPRIAAFERAAELEDGASLTGHRQPRRYIEDRFEPGDRVTVYGRVEPTSDATVTATRLELTADDTDFRILRDRPAATKRKRLLAAGLMFGLGSAFAGLAITML